MWRTQRSTLRRRLFSLAGGVFGRGHVGFAGCRLALRGGRRSCAVSAGSARGGSFPGVVGNIPARAFELHSGCRKQLLQFAPTMRADCQRRIGKLLDPFGQAVTLLALVFVKRQWNVRNPSKFLILFSASGCGQLVASRCCPLPPMLLSLAGPNSPCVRATPPCLQPSTA